MVYLLRILIGIVVIVPGIPGEKHELDYSYVDGD
jgi:hypothetical protein